MVCRSRLRSAVGQQHELATSAAGKADVERLAPVFEDEGLRDGDREAPLGSKSAELAELVPTQLETAFSLDVLRAGARAGLGRALDIGHRDDPPGVSAGDLDQIGAAPCRNTIADSQARYSSEERRVGKEGVS